MLSPSGKYALHFSDADHAWHTVRVSDGRDVSLTARLPVSFVDETWDRPNDPPPYGAAGWTANDASVLLYDRCDIWEMSPDGSGARQITRGAGRTERITFRYERVDPEDAVIASDRPLLLSAVAERTRQSGIYRTTLAAPGALERVVMLDKSFGRLTRAKDADVFVFTLSRFDRTEVLEWETRAGSLGALEEGARRDARGWRGRLQSGGGQESRCRGRGQRCAHNRVFDMSQRLPQGRALRRVKLIANRDHSEFNESL